MSLDRKTWPSWIVVFLSPLWAYVLVELLRLIDFSGINRYGGWQFDEIYCNREVLQRLDVVHAEYWHFPTLEAWIICTVSFLVLGSGSVLRFSWVKRRNPRRRLFLLLVSVFILAALYTLYSLIAPRRLPNPFFKLNAISLLLVSIWLVVQGYHNKLSWHELVRLVIPVFGAYVLGLIVGSLVYMILFDLDLLPAVAYC